MGCEGMRNGGGVRAVVGVEADLDRAAEREDAMHDGDRRRLLGGLAESES